VTEPAPARTPPTPAVDSETQAPISTKPLVSRHTRRVTTIVSVVVVLVVLAALVAMGYFMYTSYDRVGQGVTPGTVRLRDMAFVVMALGTLVSIVLMLIVIVLLMVIIVLTYDRLIPVLEQMNKTINTVADTAYTVRGTATFVGEKVVSPVIEVSSYAAGVARILKGVADLWPGPRKSGDGQK
jgi:hypothetical protein